mmetsp:Transcript_2218/g.7013  ORF Transcript_2218/g.7013 Transcript_2218/m.7013 type:complete len:222 (-) Transcript_2218:438-1103(-)
MEIECAHMHGCKTLRTDWRVGCTICWSLVAMGPHWLLPAGKIIHGLHTSENLMRHLPSLDDTSMEKEERIGSAGLLHVALSMVAAPGMIGFGRASRDLGLKVDRVRSTRALRRVHPAQENCSRRLLCRVDMRLVFVLVLGPHLIETHINNVLYRMVNIWHQRDARHADHRGKPPRQEAGRQPFGSVVDGVDHLMYYHRGHKHGGNGLEGGGVDGCAQHSYG